MARIAQDDAELPAFAPPKKPANFLEARRQITSGEAGKYAQYAEINRIVSMATIFDMNQAELEEFNREHVLADAFADGFRLFPVQANAVLAYEMFGGLFGPIGVGWGKTLITLMIPHLAYMRGVRKMLLLVPPQILPQLVETDIKYARTKVPISYPIHVLGGKSMRQRVAIAQSGKKGLYIMPYSQLSTKDTDDLLTAIAPELIVGDEAHRIANDRAARTRRVQWLIDEYKPECVFVSGTVTSKSVSDYYHLIRAALRDNNPLPNTKSLVHEWGAIIDAEQVNWSQHPDGGEDRKSGPGPLMPLVDWARKNFPEEQIEGTTDGFRKAYRLRLTTAPGVVASGEADIGTSIIFQNRPVEGYEKVEGWGELNKLISKVEDQWLTPNDDEIEHAIHTWKWLNELSAGFYNQLAWPEYEDYAKRRRISIDEAAEILDKARTYHAADQVFAKTLRRWLEEYAKPKLDTPLLVRHNISQHGSRDVGTELYETWMEKEHLDFEGRPDRDSTAVRVCPFKVNAAADWAESIKGGGMVWFHHQEIGRWLYDVFRQRGIDCVYCPAGKSGNEKVLDPANRSKMLIASITAHGEGKNLQHFQEQICVQWPRSAKIAEQLLGRLHRNGQEADELEVRMINTLIFDRMNFAACLNDALYIHQSTGVRQKLVYGGYDPLPQIFPAAVLKERGIEGIKTLNAEQQRLMQEKFG